MSGPIKGLIVISVEFPDFDDLVEILDHIDPPHVPHFDKEVRIVVGDDVADVIKFLEEGDSDGDGQPRGPQSQRQS